MWYVFPVISIFCMQQLHVPHIHHSAPDQIQTHRHSENGHARMLRLHVIMSYHTLFFSRYLPAPLPCPSGGVWAVLPGMTMRRGRGSAMATAQSQARARA